MHQELQNRLRAGQFVWIDDLSRGMIESGELARWIAQGVSGVTTNPTIFGRSLDRRADLVADVHALCRAGLSPREVYEALLIEDVQDAADELAAMHRDSDGESGYVSLELPADCAHDAERTVAESQHLWTRARRPNVMLKIPATAEGLTALPELMRRAIPVNLTLIFSSRQLAACWRAWCDAVARLEPAAPGATVTFSMLLGRIDVAVDRALGCDEALPSWASNWNLMGRTALALAHEAHALHLRAAESFAERSRDRVPQPRLIWASTGAKSVAIDPLKYALDLPLERTILTAPAATLEKLLAARVAPAAPMTERESRAVLDCLPAHGIDVERMAVHLQEAGLRDFEHSADDALDRIVALASRRRPRVGDDDDDDMPSPQADPHSNVCPWTLGGSLSRGR